MLAFGVKSFDFDPSVVSSYLGRFMDYLSIAEKKGRHPKQTDIISGAINPRLSVSPKSTSTLESTPTRIPIAATEHLEMKISKSQRGT